MYWELKKEMEAGGTYTMEGQEWSDRDALKWNPEKCTRA
jgi:hypothetical protein